MVALMEVDMARDLGLRCKVSWRAYIGCLFNPFTPVRRRLVFERRLPQRENLLWLLQGGTACIGAARVFFARFRVDWTGLPFLFEHISKVVTLMGAIVSGLMAAAAVWRSYNRVVQQFFWENVFGEGRRLVGALGGNDLGLQSFDFGDLFCKHP